MSNRPGNTDKATLRTQLRRVRRSLSARDRKSLDKSINQALLEFVSARPADHIAAYWAFDGEPDLMPALRELDRQGRHVSLPVIVDDHDGPCISFRAWNRDVPMEGNRYGIPEPSGTRDIRSAEIGLMLVPLVGWDQSGARLGMGAGLYDRFLARTGLSASAILAGVAYQVQKTERVPMDSWDVRMHAVLSETGWFTCPS
jgi:5-formyltetrahydrofolate cyclo-ligase